MEWAMVDCEYVLKHIKTISLQFYQYKVNSLKQNVYVISSNQTLFAKITVNTFLF